MNAPAEIKRYRPDALRELACALFTGAGMDREKASTVAEFLTEGDLMGHTTHGLALAPRYLQEIQDGAMRVTGDPGILVDRGACVSWDGRRLPGVWLLASAVRLAAERARTYGTVTVAVGNSHHNACLAAYLNIATDRNLMVMIASSDPSQANVAPFGGVRALYSPNPIAVGIPTNADPILIDTSCSITTNNMSLRLQREGRKYDRPWLLDAAGEPTNDPAVLKEGGSTLPVGGMDHGQKGYNWAILVEALTQGLSGFGRADGPKGWGASVYVQVIDPSAFAGLDAYTRQTGWFASACRATPPRPGVERVRVPGEHALARKRDAERDGVALYPGVLESLKPWAEKLAVTMPTAVND